MITQEQRTNSSETAAVGGLTGLLDKRKIIAVVSSIVKVEVLEADMLPQQREVYEGVMRRKRQVQVKDVTNDITNLAAEIRNYYKDQRNKNPLAIKPPSTPDAIHLATAIYYGCEKFYTFDENDKKDNCGLLKMTNPIAGKYNIEITKPIVPQGGLNI